MLMRRFFLADFFLKIVSDFKTYIGNYLRVIFFSQDFPYS